MCNCGEAMQLLQHGSAPAIPDTYAARHLQHIAW